MASLDSISRAAGDALAEGNLNTALSLFREAVDLAVDLGDPRALSGLLGDLAVTHRRRGDIPAAIETNRRAIDVARGCGHHLDVACWSGNLGGIFYRAGLVDEAEACFREAVDAAAHTGSAEQMSLAAGHLAAIMGERGRFSDAVESMAEARAHEDVSPPVRDIILDQELVLYLRWAHSLRSDRRLRQAREVVERALASEAARRAREEVVALWILGAELDENEGDIASAVEALERASEAAKCLGHEEQVRRLRELAERMGG